MAYLGRLAGIGVRRTVVDITRNMVALTLRTCGYVDVLFGICRDTRSRTALQFRWLAAAGYLSSDRASLLGGEACVVHASVKQLEVKHPKELGVGVVQLLDALADLCRSRLGRHYARIQHPHRRDGGQVGE